MAGLEPFERELEAPSPGGLTIAPPLGERFCVTGVAPAGTAAGNATTGVFELTKPALAPMPGT
ncbi:MAG: hypothetical protein FJY54_15170 [Betaproteobacteria bacterium]|nr:hypothetical protein [Betaproteobacteria bacterium]